MIPAPAEIKNLSFTENGNCSFDVTFSNSVIRYTAYGVKLVLTHEDGTQTDFYSTADRAVRHRITRSKSFEKNTVIKSYEATEVLPNAFNSEVTDAKGNVLKLTNVTAELAFAIAEDGTTWGDTESRAYKALLKRRAS